MNKKLDPFEWLDLIICNLDGIKKTSAKIKDVEKCLNQVGIEESKKRQILSELEKPILSGKNAKFTTLLGIKPPSIYDWRKRGKIPAGRVEDIVEIARKHDILVRRHDLRPDKWGINDEPIKAGRQTKNIQSLGG